ncbi:MAG: NapC/NirT family cytochrome c [Thermoleophilia bacterium]|nr:NapC/NirT family cytochrome c [Thermoleophilia bacterium]
MNGRSILAVALAVLLVAIVGVTVWGIDYTNRPGFCSSCHIIEPYVETWSQSLMGGGLSGDRSVTCIDCHFEPGVIGFTRGKIYSLMKLTEFAIHRYETPPPSAELLTSTSCLECHGSDPRPNFEDSTNVVDREHPSYPRIIVTDTERPENVIGFPHDFHVVDAQISCAECHSAVVHGTDLIQGRPQADNTPEFCGSCHAGDIAPILFGEIPLSGREHPGVPKIDTSIWKNQHWRVSKAPGVIDGVMYDAIERDTCLVCHQEPTVDRTCKSCHFPSEPLFAATPETQRTSAFPLAMFGLVIGIFLVTILPYPKAKRFLFEGWPALIAAAAVLATNVYAVYKLFTDVLQVETGARQIGPATLWIAYMLASASLLIFLFHQGVLVPRRRRLSGRE